ncbi:MAG: hypothetical protein FWG34_10130 [Oscillospiraceae bacterium]|nr:hypothetical protein [Oscillospiraceae bacterium]
MKTWILVDRTTPDQVSGIAMKRFTNALEQAGIAFEKRITWTGELPERIIIAAKNTDALAGNLLRDKLTAPESVQFMSFGAARVISGSDERGLAYALMEMAERVESCGERALDKLEGLNQSPHTKIRGMDRLIANTGDCEWWMDEKYWRWYLEELLAVRFNRLVLLVGFDTPYLSPPYPFFVDVPEYPGVKVITPGLNRTVHLDALRKLGRLVHEYGMEFVFATWQQSLWTSDQTAMVEGIDADNLSAYCAAGIRELALQCPEIDMIQFRVNHESGVGTHITAEDFWCRMIDGLADAKDTGRKVKLDLRAKGLTDNMIAYAKEQGFELTVSTKYWCEQAGLPYHLTRMRTEELKRFENLNHSRRYSYADMHKKPRLHDFLYRLWNDGSTDLFTWGDPDYVRRFIASLELGDAVGFELMPPLSLKGGAQDMMYTGWHIFDDPKMRFGKYEDERYWLFWRLFGRIGYDLREVGEAWLRPMKQHFGAAADPLLAAVSVASRIVPFIVASHMPVHPQLHYWAELSTGAALFAEHNHNRAFKHSCVTYQNTEPSDAGLFYPIEDYVRDALESREDGRYTPYQRMAWLESMANNTQKYLEQARSLGLPDRPEARGLELDLMMLRELALYHRNKIAAAIFLCLCEIRKRKGYAFTSLEYMKNTRAHWNSLAELGKAYHKNLVFMVGGGKYRTGTWSDYFPEIGADIAKLKEIAEDAPLPFDEIHMPTARISPPAWSDNLPKNCPSGKDLPVTLELCAQDGFRGNVRVRYRHTNQLEGAFLSGELVYSNGAWHGEIPGNYITPEWDLLVYFEAVSHEGDGIIYPGIWHPQHALPYHIVRVQ